MQKEHDITYIYDKFKTVGVTSLSEYEEKKKSGSSTLEKISSQIKFINNLMDRHETEITKAFNANRDDFKKLSESKKKLVFTFISCLRDTKRNLLYLNEYFKQREKFLKENGKTAELAFIWSVHRKTVVDLINFYLETKKKMKLLSDLKDFKGEVSSFAIDNETYDSKKKNMQSSTDRTTSLDKIGGFEEEQKKANFEIMKKTKKLILKMRKEGLNGFFPTPLEKEHEFVMEGQENKIKEKVKEKEDPDNPDIQNTSNADENAITRSVTEFAPEEEINTSNH